MFEKERICDLDLQIYDPIGFAVNDKLRGWDQK